jgi:diadenosine tetraphosphate (Ap4A) HIT family hydrolase
MLALICHRATAQQQQRRQQQQQERRHFLALARVRLKRATPVKRSSRVARSSWPAAARRSLHLHFHIISRSP